MLSVQRQRADYSTVIGWAVEQPYIDPRKITAWGTSDRERRALMRANEERLSRYQLAAERWAVAWPAVHRQIEGLPLLEAHRVVTSAAEGTLPFAPGPGGDS